MKFYLFFIIFIFFNGTINCQPPGWLRKQRQRELAERLAADYDYGNPIPRGPGRRFRPHHRPGHGHREHPRFRPEPDERGPPHHFTGPHGHGRRRPPHRLPNDERGRPYNNENFDNDEISDPTITYMNSTEPEVITKLPNINKPLPVIEPDIVTDGLPDSRNEKNERRLTTPFTKPSNRRTTVKPISVVRKTGKPGAKNSTQKPKNLLKQAERTCGLIHNAKIVGGAEADANTWLWVTALIKRSDSKLFCGGSLITNRHVLTAAHCLNKLTPKDLFVRIGSNDASEDADASAEDHEVIHFRIHPDYDKRSHNNDIAIMTLKKAAKFTDTVRPVCLPPLRRSFFDHLATAVGWGSKVSGESGSTKLRQVTLPIWNQTACTKVFGSKIKETSLCAGFPEGGKDACQGDSGGPLMLETANKKWSVIGIVSWGINCGQPGYPGVYTRVSHFLDWIDNNVKIDNVSK